MSASYLSDQGTRDRIRNSLTSAVGLSVGFIAACSTNGYSLPYGDRGYCGDAVVDHDEDCDDGNTVQSDDCPDTCESATCGDGFVWTSDCGDVCEGCDDTNAELDDGCDSTCGVEPDRVEWETPLRAEHIYLRVHDVATDADGAIYVVLTTEVDSSPGVLQKYTPEGARAWTRSSTQCAYQSLTFDGDDSVIAGGRAVQPPLLCLAGYDLDGQVLWTANDSIDGLHSIQDMTVGGDGEVIASVALDSPLGLQRAGLVKYGAEGRRTFSEFPEPYQEGFAVGVAPGPEGSFYFAQIGLFPEHPISQQLIVQRRAADGSVLWWVTDSQTDQPLSDRPYAGIAPDRHGGVVVAGGGDPARVRRFSALGDQVAAHTIATSPLWVMDVATDRNGDAAVIGAVLLDREDSNAAYAPYLCMHDPGGTRLWSRVENPVAMVPLQLVTDPAGDLFVVGHRSGDREDASYDTPVVRKYAH